MEASSEGRQCSSCSWFKAKFEKVEADVVHIYKTAKQLARDDPRKVVHSIKVGLAITLVSLFYYFDPLYEGFGVNAMWAVLTVVVVFEYSVGATLGKGVNRVLATILGGMLGVVAHRLASLSGDKFEPAFLGLSVFMTAAVTTFIRFFPRMKARFDYGLVIFILTFSLICVSGYRDDEVIDMAHRRVTTILIGTSTAVLVCVAIWPVWSGTDLHKLVAANIDKLGDFFQEFGVQYFGDPSEVSPNGNNEASLNGFKSILDSKNNIDSLANFARWEPQHGRFKLHHPWIQYQKVGELARHCACRAEALHGYLYTHIQAPKEVKAKFKEPCVEMSTESGKALKELSFAIKKMTQSSTVKPHIENAKQAAHNLDLLLKSSIWENVSLSDVTPVATVASLLADVVACTVEITEAVQELASLVNFKNNGDGKVAPEIDDASNKLDSRGLNKRQSFANHVITIEGSSSPMSPKYSGSDNPPSLAMSQQVAE